MNMVGVAAAMVVFLAEQAPRRQYNCAQSICDPPRENQAGGQSEIQAKLVAQGDIGGFHLFCIDR